MSGTYQSKLATKREEMDLQHSNNLNSSISSNNEKEVAAECSNTAMDELDDDREGTLQLQIQETIAATIRASKISSEQLPTNNDDGSAFSDRIENEGSQNMETIQNCDANKPAMCDGIDTQNQIEVPNTFEPNLQTQDLSEASCRNGLNNLIHIENLPNEPVNNLSDDNASNNSVPNEQDNKVQTSEKLSSNEASAEDDILVESEQDTSTLSKNTCSSSLDTEDGEKSCKENLEVVEEDESFDSNKSLSSVQNDNLNNCVDNNQSDDNAGVSVENSRIFEKTTAEQLPAEQQDKSPVSSHDENDTSFKCTITSVESENGAGDVVQVKNKVENIQSKGPIEDALVCEEQTKNKGDDTEDQMEIQNAITETQIVTESKIVISDHLPINNEQENNSKNSISDNCSLNDINIISTDKTLAGQDIPDEIEKAAETTSNEKSNKKEFPIDINQITQLNDCEHKLCLSTANKLAESSKSETANKEIPMDITQTTQLHNCEDNLSVRISNTLQENLNIEENSENTKGEASNDKEIPMDVTQTTPLNNSEDNLSISNTLQENLNAEEDVEVLKSESSGNKEIPVDITHITSANDSEDSLSISNTLQENVNTEENADISKGQTSDIEIPMDVTHTTPLNGCEDNRIVGTVNIVPENLDTQKDAEISKSETSASKDFPTNEAHTTPLNDREDNLSAKRFEENLNTQENAESCNSELSGSKDFPTDVDQTTPLNDCEDNLSIETAIVFQENLNDQEDAENSNGVVAEVTDPLDIDPTESHVQVDLDHSIFNMHNEDVFPVIEIMEAESDVSEVVEVIDTDERIYNKMEPEIVPKELQQVTSVSIKSLSTIQNPDGGCIEILSDEDEVQVQEKDTQNVEIPLKDNIVDLPRRHLQYILQQIKMLTSSEYLLFYLKLPSKWDQDRKSKNLSEKIRDKLESNVISIPEENDRILNAIVTSISKVSKKRVQKIINRIMDLTAHEYLWVQSNLPTDCINPNLRCLLPHGSDASRTILWLKTHFEESSNNILPKHEVFNQYQAFCQKHNLHTNSTSSFGKLIRKVFTKLGQKRLRAKGNSSYYYIGLQPRFVLDPPHLPNLSEKKPLRAEKELMESEDETDCASTNNQFDEQSIVLNDLSNMRQSNRLIMETESENDSYRSKQLDGQTILVHDPLALLNVCMTDKDAHVGKVNKITKSSPLRTYAGPKYQSRPRSSPLVINNSVHKVKFKEYRHPSVRKVFKEFNTIVLPPEVYRLNISPSVILDNTEMNNWYAGRLKNFTHKLSNLIIKKANRSQSFDVSYTCCDDVFEVSDSYANELRNFKEKFSNLIIRKSKNSTNDEVVRILSNDVQTSKLLNQTFPIVKRLTNQNTFKISIDSGNVRERNHNKHPSVQRLHKKCKGITLPKDVIKSDIDPVVVLDSGEVIGWYVKQLDRLKQKLSNDRNFFAKSMSDLKLHGPSTRQSTSARHSRAKIMNFCEIDSSDYDSDNVNTREYLPPAFVEQYTATNTGNAVAVISPDYIAESIPEVRHKFETEVVDEPPECSYTTVESVQQQLCPTRKRICEDEANENDLKRKKFFCSKITISPNCRASISEQPSTSNVEQRPCFEEKFVERYTSPVSEEGEVFACHLCSLVFGQRKEFVIHKQAHLFCATCCRMLQHEEAMRQHLIKHCSLNTIQSKPILKLRRIDTDPSIVKKYPETFQELAHDVQTLYSKTVKARTAHVTQRTTAKFYTKEALHSRPNILSASGTNLRIENLVEVDKPQSNAKEVYKRTYSRLPRCTAVRIFKSADNASSPIQTSTVPTASTAVSSEPQQNTVQQPMQQAPMFELKNTISNNLNKILLSNNVSQSQLQSPNILYGTLYVNNTSGQSSPTICLNSSFYNPTVSTSSTDCAVNTNPSCSNPDLRQTPTFMQIVESPNPSLMQYTAPISQNDTLVTFEHQDHSYHQQPKLFHIGNNIPTTNNIVLVSNNVSPQTELQPTTVNTSTSFTTPLFDQPAKTSETETTNYLLNSAESTSSSNPPMPGQFRIRVKSIQELR